MDFSYPKEEKLKSRKIIDLLFTEGKSVAKFPLRLMYVGINNDSDGSIKFGVSVSKKYFKKAGKLLFEEQPHRPIFEGR